MKKMKKGLAKEENGNQNFIKNGTLEPKEAFGMKSLGDLKLFENQKLENHFKTGLEIIILKSKGKSLRGVAHGSISGHARGGHAYLPQRFDWLQTSYCSYCIPKI